MRTTLKKLCSVATATLLVSGLAIALVPSRSLAGVSHVGGVTTGNSSGFINFPQGGGGSGRVGASVTNALSPTTAGLTLPSGLAPALAAVRSATNGAQLESALGTLLQAMRTANASASATAAEKQAMQDVANQLIALGLFN